MLVLIGPSASGKTEIAKILIRDFGMRKLVTYTTRAMRPGEKNGIDYNFVTVDEFKTLETAGEFVETTLYNGNYYGTRKKDVDLNKVVVLDPSGLNRLCDMFGEVIVTVLLETAEETRIERMRKRGDRADDIEKRIAGDAVVFNRDNIKRIDRVVENDKAELERLAVDIYRFYYEKIQKNHGE